MIRYFAVKNFRSIKEEAILEFDAGKSHRTSFPANSTIGVAGSNASGKTSVLQALTFVLWFMDSSFFEIQEGHPIPYQPFYTSSEEPTEFHIIFIHEILVDSEKTTVDFEYQLSILKSRVITEELSYYPYRVKRKVYSRNGSEIQFGASTSRLKKEVLVNLRENCSVISFAAQFASQEIAIACRDYRSHSNVSYSGLEEQRFNRATIEYLLANRENRDKIIQMLQLADIGISDIKVKTRTKQEVKEAIDRLRGSREKDLQKALKSVEEYIESLSGDSEVFLPSDIRFEHKLGDTSVGFTVDYESSGTIQFLIMLHIILQALQEGSLVIIDEIEIKLHQSLVAYLIGLFQNKNENPLGAQLIFSFHNTALMKTLSPEQLWFTEKNDSGATEVFSASDFKDIKKLHQKNLEELYRIGRFGAKPAGI